MAASATASTSNKAGEASASVTGPDSGFWPAQGPVVLRDPAVKLLTPVSGAEPLSWSEDHRLAACSTNSVSLMELLCDVRCLSQDLVLHRSHVPVPDAVHELKVKCARACSLVLPLYRSLT